MALRLLLLMSALGVTHLPVVTCPEEPTNIHPCQGVDYKGMSPNLPCMVRNETFFSGSDATREMDIRMGLPQLMLVLNNSQNMQLENVGLTIANGEIIVNYDHAAKFRERWIIAISAEVDQEQGFFLRYKLTVRNPSFNDESSFRLVYRKDDFSFSTESKIWFPTPSQESAPTTQINHVPVADTTKEPESETPTIPTISPPETECLSLEEFHQAIDHQNDMIAELKQSSLCDWKCTLGIAAVAAVLAVLLVLLLLKIPRMIKYFYPKIISAYSRLTAVPQNGSDHPSLRQVITPGSQPGAQPDVKLLDLSPSTSSQDQNLQITADVQDEPPASE